MTTEELALTKRWVENWKAVGPELERIREDEVRRENTMRAFEAFKGMALLEIARRPPDANSGLVEQQRRFALVAKRQRPNVAS